MPIHRLYIDDFSRTTLSPFQVKVKALPFLLSIDVFQPRVVVEGETGRAGPDSEVVPPPTQAVPAGGARHHPHKRKEYGCSPVGRYEPDQPQQAVRATLRPTRRMGEASFTSLSDVPARLA
jgi:hypothetical protein